VTSHAPKKTLIFSAIRPVAMNGDSVDVFTHPDTILVTWIEPAKGVTGETSDDLNLVSGLNPDSSCLKETSRRSPDFGHEIVGEDGDSQAMPPL